MNRHELRTASSIALLYLVRMLGLFMVLPVLALAGPELGGATPLLIGFALGVYGLSQAVLQIPMGLLSDRYGRRLVIMAGLLLFIAGSVVAALTDTIVGVIAGRVLQGCGAIASTLLALMSDLTRVDQRGKSMAIIGIAIASSFGLSLVIGPLIFSHAGLSGVFWFAGASGVAGLLVLLVFIPATTTRSHNVAAVPQLEQLGSVLKDAALNRLYVGIFMSHYLLMSAFLVFPGLLLDVAGIPVNEHHTYYFFMLLASGVLMFPFMWLSDKAGYGKAVLLAAIALVAVSLLLIGGAGGPVAIVAGVTLFFTAFNLLEVVLPARVSQVAAAGSRGSAMGVYSTAQFGGTFAGGAVGGVLLSLWDTSMLLTVNALLCLGWLLLSLNLPSLANIASRTFCYDDSCPLSANQILERLSSLHGVIDVVLIEEEHIAYLKVDVSGFEDDSLQALIDKPGETLPHPNA